MRDNITPRLLDFQKERGWEKFHSPENLAKSIAIEAGELLECFQWDSTSRAEKARMELADVLTYSYLLAEKLGEKPEDLILEKLEITAKKYPADKFFGSSRKYSEPEE